MFILAILLLSWNIASKPWTVKECGTFTLHYPAQDESNFPEYFKLLNNGCEVVEGFFRETFKNTFNVFIYPNRISLDKALGKERKTPGFKSQCKMVALWTGDKLDMISPKSWDKESCGYHYKDKEKTRKLITRELFHIYHGQIKTNPFSDADSIAWFVEGFATFASGQCDSTKMNEIKKAFKNNEITLSLNKFWTGKYRSGLSGSLVMYIDKEFGREKLRELLKVDTKKDILNALAITEKDLLERWTKFIQSYNARL